MFRSAHALLQVEGSTWIRVRAEGLSRGGVNGATYWHVINWWEHAWRWIEDGLGGFACGVLLGGGSVVTGSSRGLLRLGSLFKWDAI